MLYSESFRSQTVYANKTSRNKCFGDLQSAHAELDSPLCVEMKTTTANVCSICHQMASCDQFLHGRCERCKLEASGGVCLVKTISKQPYQTEN